jgi:hypothetical protein
VDDVGRPIEQNLLHFTAHDNSSICLSSHPDSDGYEARATHTHGVHELPIG